MCSIIGSNTTCTTAILLWFSAVMNSPAKVVNKTTVQSSLDWYSMPLFSSPSRIMLLPTLPCSWTWEHDPLLPSGFLLCSANESLGRRRSEGGKGDWGIFLPTSLAISLSLRPLLLLRWLYWILPFHLDPFWQRMLAFFLRVIILTFLTLELEVAMCLANKTTFPCLACKWGQLMKSQGKWLGGVLRKLFLELKR